MLTLDRPLVCLDLEATGTDPEEARIIQVALQRFEPEQGFAGAYTTLVDPGTPIPEQIQDLTGITQDDVERKGAEPAEALESVRLRIQDADLAGYNLLSYDLPLLEAEWKRHVSSSLPGPDDRKVIDAYQLEKRLRPRTLEAVYERRTGQPLEDAHDAAADVKATWTILKDQALEANESGNRQPSPADLVDFQRGDYLDAGQKLKGRDDGSVEVCFGKYAGKTLSWLEKNDRDYLGWVYDEITELQEHIDEALGEWRSVPFA